MRVRESRQCFSPAYTGSAWVWIPPEGPAQCTHVSRWYLGSSFIYQCCGSGMFIPDLGSEFFPSRIPDPGSKNHRILDPDSYPHRILTQKIVSRLSEIWSKIIIPDPSPGSWFLPIQDPESRGQKGTGSRIRNTAYNAYGIIWEFSFTLDILYFIH